MRAFGYPRQVFHMWNNCIWPSQSIFLWIFWIISSVLGIIYQNSCKATCIYWAAELQSRLWGLLVDLFVCLLFSNYDCNRSVATSLSWWWRDSDHHHWWNINWHSKSGILWERLTHCPFVHTISQGLLWDWTRHLWWEVSNWLGCTGSGNLISLYIKELVDKNLHQEVVINIS
jgi:hypothetical protein